MTHQFPWLIPIVLIAGLAGLPKNASAQNVYSPYDSPYAPYDGSIYDYYGDFDEDTFGDVEDEEFAEFEDEYENEFDEELAYDDDELGEGTVDGIRRTRDTDFDTDPNPGITRNPYLPTDPNPAGPDPFTGYGTYDPYDYGADDYGVGYDNLYTDDWFDDEGVYNHWYDEYY